MQYTGVAYFMNDPKNKNQFSYPNDGNNINWKYIGIIQSIPVCCRAEYWREADQTIAKSPRYKGNALTLQFDIGFNIHGKISH